MLYLSLFDETFVVLLCRETIMSKTRVRIVVTDGKDTVSIGNIRHDKHIVVSQLRPKGQDQLSHVTYHENGYMGYTVKGSSSTGMYYGPPLSKFSGLVSGASYGIPKRVTDLGHQGRSFANDNRAIDHVVYIDTRTSGEGIQYKVFICEPGFPIAPNIQWLKDGSGCADLSYSVCTAVEPWVGVIFWSRPQPEVGIRATSEFRRMLAAEGERLSGAIQKEGAETCPNGVTICEGPDGTGDLCRSCMNTLT